ncbi:MAG: hypothetical protein RR657_02670 [Peptostreptococcaceae bacterium]
MKKTLILIMTLISIFILVGCSNTLDISENGKVNSEELVSAIEKVNKDSNIYFVKDKERLSIEFNYKNNNKEIYKNFKDDVNTIIDKDKKTLLEYKEIKEIDFTPVVNKQTLGCNIIYKIEGDNITLYEDNASEESIKAGIDILNGDSNLTGEASKENTTPEKTLVEIPDSGEFSNTGLSKALNIGDTNLQYSNFKVEKSGDTKIIKIDLLYKNQALTKGILNEIQNKIEEALGYNGYEIDLSINQKDPIDSYSCKYINGSWSK